MAVELLFGMSMLIITQKFFLNKICNLNLPFPFVLPLSSLSIIISFIYLILMCYFYHIGEYQLFSIMNPHMLTERQLTNGDNAACYFRVEKSSFFPSLQCRHSVSCAPLSPICFVF